MRRVLIPTCLLLTGLSLACNANKVGEDTAPPEGDTDTDTDTDTDSDTDADSDADSDADADADSDADTDPIGDYYAGDFEVYMSESNVFNMADTCLGTVELWHSLDQDPPFQGGFTCDFQGQLASFGTQVGDVEASGEDTLDGTIVIEVPYVGGYDVPWEGTFVDDTIVATGEYAETMEFYGYKLIIEVAMDFEAALEG